jgi:hypothetical protein
MNTSIKCGEVLGRFGLGNEMNKARIKEEAEHFFEWPDPKRRDHVTLASCLIFAEVIAGMAVDAEREECAKVAAWVLKMPENDVSSAIRARGNK